MALAVEVEPETLPLPADRLAAQIDQVLVAAGYPGNLSLAVVDDAAMRRVNREYHATDTATDVLAFPLRDPPQPELPGFDAEIVVSADTARREADALGVDAASELVLYVVHGVLHLLGYDDHEPDEARRMHARTLEILGELGYENRIDELK